MKLVNDFLSAQEAEQVRTTKALLVDKLATYREETSKLFSRSLELQRQMPTVTEDTYRDVEVALGTTKLALATNAGLMNHYSATINDIEGKLASLNQNAASEEIAILKKQISGLHVQRSIAKNEGMAEESGKVQSIDSEMRNLTRKLQVLVSKVDFKKLSPSGDADSSTRIERMGHLSNSIDSINDQNDFYRAKRATLDNILASLRAQISQRLVAQVQVAETNREIQFKQKLMETLEESLVKLDLANFKVSKKMDMYAGQITEKSTHSLVPILAFCFVLGIGLAIAFAFLSERKNPSLRSVRAFTELGLPVLGAIPSTHQILFANGAESNNPEQQSYLRLSIDLGNLLAAAKSKTVLISGSNSASQSATFAFNLASCYAKTGRKTLLIEADFKNNFLSKMMGLTESGGLERASVPDLSEDAIRAVTIENNFEFLNGDSSKLDGMYRMASQSFAQLLTRFETHYEYIVIHTQPCLEGPESADLSRYCGAALLCCDSAKLKASHLEKIVTEIQFFLSATTYFVFEKTREKFKNYPPTANNVIHLPRRSVGDSENLLLKAS